MIFDSQNKAGDFEKTKEPEINEKGVRKDLKLAQTEVEKIIVHPELSLKNMDKLIFKNKKIVIVDYNATWCGPCKQTEKILNEFYALFSDQIEIIKLTKDENRDAINIKKIIEKRIDKTMPSLPTLLYVKNGKLMWIESNTWNLFDLMEKFKKMGLKTDKFQEEKAEKIFPIMAKTLGAGALFENLESIPESKRHECILSAAESDPISMLKNYNFYKDFKFRDQYIKKAGESAMNSHKEKIIKEAFELSHLFAHFPEADKWLKKGAKNNPFIAVFDIKHYIDQPYFIDVLKVAADTNAESILGVLPVVEKDISISAHTKNKDKIHSTYVLFEKYVLKTAKNNPEIFATHLTNIIKHKYTNGIENYGFKLFEKTLKEKPFIGIINLRSYQQLPDAAEKFQTSVDWTLKNKPEFIFKYYHTFINIDEQFIKKLKYNKKEIFSKAIDSMEKINPKIFFENIRYYFNFIMQGLLSEKQIEAIIKKHYRKYPDLVIKNRREIIKYNEGEQWIEELEKKK